MCLSQRTAYSYFLQKYLRRLFFQNVYSTLMKCSCLAKFAFLKYNKIRFVFCSAWSTVVLRQRCRMMSTAAQWAPYTTDHCSPHKCGHSFLAMPIVSQCLSVLFVCLLTLWQWKCAQQKASSFVKLCRTSGRRRRAKKGEHERAVKQTKKNPLGDGPQL